MAVIVTMPDGTEQEFPDISSAKAYKRALLADPNVGGALKLTGDPEQAKTFLEIQGKGQDLKKGALEEKKLSRELEGLSPGEAISRGLNQMEDDLADIPVGSSGPYAIMQGKWEKAKGAMGYEPMRSFSRTRESLAVPLRRYLGDKGTLSETDINTAVNQLPGIDDPMDTRRELFRKIRTVTGLPDRQRAWDVMQRHAIQAPHGGQIK